MTEKSLIEKLEDAPYSNSDGMTSHEWAQISWEAAQEIKKLRAENAILKEEVRLREVIMGKKKI